jgi:hypothetical protein
VQRLKQKMRLFILGALLSLFAVSMFTNSASAITNGVPDEANHPYVCIVAFYDASGNPLWYTTGVLVSSDVVLTAGHGTFGASKALVSFQTFVGETVSRKLIYEGVGFTNPKYLGVSAGNGLPGYDYHDVGIVKLSAKVKSISPAALPSVGMVDKVPMKSLVDLVGYGVQWQEKGAGVSPYDSWLWNGYRYCAPAQVVSSNDALSSEFMKVTANPGQGTGGVAFGDSGGPILKAGTNIVLGINSFVTNNNCGGVTYAQRMDIADILSWVRSYF